MPEYEPKSEPVKNERGLDEPIKTKIINHLNYRKEKTLSFIKECERLIPESKSREISKKIEKFFAEYYKKVFQQLEKGSGKELLDELNFPNKEEVELKSEINKYWDLFGRLTLEEKKGDIGKSISETIFTNEEALVSHQAERRNWIEKLSKKEKRINKEEKVNLDL